MRLALLMLLVAVAGLVGARTAPQAHLVAERPCVMELVEPAPDSSVLVTADTRPDRAGLQAHLKIRFSPSCVGRRVVVASDDGEREELTVQRAGVEVLHDFTLVNDTSGPGHPVTITTRVLTRPGSL